MEEQANESETLNLSTENFLKGDYERIDWKKSLFENQEERNLRLEAMWLEKRLEEILSLGMDDFYNTSYRPESALG